MYQNSNLLCGKDVSIPVHTTDTHKRKKMPTKMVTRMKKQAAIRIYASRESRGSTIKNAKTFSFPFTTEICIELNIICLSLSNKLHAAKKVTPN